MGFTLEFHVRWLSPEPLHQFSINFTQMFLSVRRCAEPMTQLPRLKVKVTVQGHGICVHSISHQPFEKIFINDPLSEIMCNETTKTNVNQGTKIFKYCTCPAG